ncbi:MAG: efflux RND transporter periplasmic adaptor subunit [Candidatus Marinimicrobia bacterium]|nr:efflux RND transporter periplasmic adaptor subunit [Candidatus Neomarinimicrobiota bacterium]MCF7829335.1 efflux RND transporter periplasmic adaptor subunit [Candidatus Neomarinimicrobiota bacterium]MCF7880003.1 efflux RND transporter periplasmic adaptor subunit [Candidatus Neomarinimicrobiota bacterium]
MSDNKNSKTSENGRFGWKKTLLIAGSILLVGAAITIYIFSSEPTAERVGATKQTAMLVNVTEVDSGSFRPTITAMGTVTPAKDIILRPRVSGEIMALSENFTPGGFVEKGDTLLRIDPADYRNALQQRESELHQAVADLKLEMGRQDVAEKEFNLLEEELSPENRALVLREPQLNAARSSVESARAAVEQANLELQRTYIIAPFDAHILTRNVNIGSQVSAGENLARLVGLNTYWVEATVPLSHIRWLRFPESDDTTGSTVRVRNRTAWPDSVYRTGHLYKMVGQLEDQTRMARVLVAVDDPLAYRTGPDDVPTLMIGAFVETRIQARELTGIIRLNRDYVRKDDTVWIMEGDTLNIKNADIAFKDNQYAYIADGLNAYDKVVTTNLSTVVEGAGLRVAGSDSGNAQDS